MITTTISFRVVVVSYLHFSHGRLGTLRASFPGGLVVEEALLLHGLLLGWLLESTTNRCGGLVDVL